MQNVGRGGYLINETSFHGSRVDQRVGPKGTTRQLLNCDLADRVGSGQKVFKMYTVDSGRVGSGPVRGFKLHGGGVG